MIEQPKIIINENSLTAVLEGKTYVCHAGSPLFTDIKQSLLDADYEGAIVLLNREQAICNFSRGAIKVTDGVLYHNELAIDTSLSERILTMIREERNIDPMLAFLANLMKNPSKRAVDELYSFLSVNVLPITPDGCFMAYKNVKKDYTDKHTGTFDNSVGKPVKMPRNRVDDNPLVDCSHGLHFCSISYLQKFWGTSGRNLLIKINPKDVVSIPVNYENNKGRCCEYFVVEEVDFSQGAEEVFSTAVFKPKKIVSHDTKTKVEGATPCNPYAVKKGQKYICNRKGSKCKIASVNLSPASNGSTKAPYARVYYYVTGRYGTIRLDRFNKYTLRK